MTEAEYVQTRQQLLLIGRIISDMDLDGFLRSISHAETIGPFLDPTLYIRGARQLAAIKRIATAARELQRVVAEVKEDLGNETVC